jgi:hypothetical protein
MVEFCQLPPDVAVTQAWADTDKPQARANAASALTKYF